MQRRCLVPTLPNWDVSLQDAAAPFIVRWADVYDIPLDIAFALIAAESSFKPTAYRSEPQIQDASYGLAQTLYKTAKGMGYTGAPTGLYDPDVSLDYGFRYLRSMFDRFGTWEQAISAYNEGPGSAAIGNPGYVDKVVSRAAYFRSAWGVDQAPADSGGSSTVPDRENGPPWGLWVAGTALGIVAAAALARRS